MQCKTPCFSHLPQQGIYSPPVSLAEDNVSFHFFSWFTCDWYRRIVHRAEEEKVRMLIAVLKIRKTLKSGKVQVEWRFMAAECLSRW